MDILHLNSNFDQSTIYPTMLNNINQLSNIKGNLYYPVPKTKKNNKHWSSSFEKSYCLNKLDRVFYFNRNKKLYDDVNDKYEIKKYNFILAYSLFSNGFLAYTLKKKLNIPYIVIVQNTDVNIYFKRMIHLRGIGKSILKNAHKIIFISDSYREYVLTSYFSFKDANMLDMKSQIIPFGIDDFWFENKNKPKKMYSNKNMIKLLYVGKINPNKNLLTTIEVCKKLINEGYDVIFTIVGNIEDKKIGVQLKKYYFVNYLPFMNKEELLLVYRNNDIFIMPSMKESFGLVYAEAMTQGLPVIYTAGQGFDKHFRDGEIGFSVDCFDIYDIANRIIDINNRYELLSDNCVKLVNKFRWTNIIAQYKEVFSEISEVQKL